MVYAFKYRWLNTVHGTYELKGGLLHIGENSLEIPCVECGHEAAAALVEVEHIGHCRSLYILKLGIGVLIELLKEHCCHMGAVGLTLEEAEKRAKQYLSGALSAMLDLGKGSGPLDHMYAIHNIDAE